LVPYAVVSDVDGVSAWALLEVVPDAIVAVDADGRVVFANAQTERLFGYDRSELVGGSLEILLPARYRGRHAEHLRTFFAAPRVRGMGQGLELFGQHADGREVPIEISLSSLVVGGRPMAFAAIRDITVRTQLEAALRAREELARGLLDSAPDAMVVVDAVGVITLINQQAIEMFGYPQPELVGQPIEVLIPDRFRGRHPEHVRGFSSAPRSRTMGKCMELVARRRDGSELHVDVSLSPMAGADGLLVMAAIRDVTERLRTEAALVAARSEADQARSRFEALLDAIPDIVVAVDRDATVQFVNRVLPHLTREQVVGSNYLTYLAKDQQDIQRAALQGVLATGTPSTYEVVFGAGTAQRWFASRIGPKRHGDDIVGAVIVSREVTAEKRLETQLVASERMASMGMLAAGLAHEINNPLSSVVANLDLALMDVDALPASRRVPDDLRDELRDARDAADRVRDIVRDLKIFSRADHDRPGPVDLRRVLDSTLRMAWNEIRHRARLVKVYADVPHVEATESRLGQVFLNLVMNAAQAIPEGHSGANEIRVSTRLGARNDVVVEIADTGCGMSPEVVDSIFVPFFTTKPAGMGTGLGLAICARIVGELGGTIEVESEPGAGTVFRVQLPAARSEDLPRSAPLLVVATVGPRGRVLVIDDEQTIGTAVRRVLSREHDVVITTGAQEARARLATGDRFDVIVCDLMMPNVTGVEFFEQLVRDDPGHAERVIFLTGGAFTTSTRTFLENVKNLWIEKPFDASQLRALVNDRVRRERE